MTKARVVLVDLADPKEVSYVADLQLGALTVPTVVVLNAAGKRTAALSAPWTAKDLVTAAVRDGCGCSDGACGHGNE